MKRSLIVLAAVSLSACVSQTPVQTVDDVYVTRWTHLARSDREEIVRVVTTASRRHLLGITQFPKERKLNRVEVYTGSPDGTGEFTEFTLQKTTGRWIIVDRGRISPSVVFGVALSWPPPGT
jgi:hypothetical protein